MSEHGVRQKPLDIMPLISPENFNIEGERPEDYIVHGGEAQHRPIKSPRKNTLKITKSSRNTGKECVSPITKKVLTEIKLKNGRFVKKGFSVDEETRLQILLKLL